MATELRWRPGVIIFELAACPTGPESAIGQERRARHNPTYGEVARDLQVAPSPNVSRDVANSDKSAGH